MNLSENEKTTNEETNIFSLFGFKDAELFDDPLRDLLEEGQIEDEPEKKSEAAPRKLVSENLFPDQSIYILEDQLTELKSKINRMKFYLEEISEILPG